MKFTNGYWLLKDEIKAVYAVEYASHKVKENEVTVYLPSSHIADKRKLPESADVDPYFI